MATASFYNLPRDTELLQTLKAITREAARGEGEIVYGGKQLKKKISQKGNVYFRFQAGLPVDVTVVQKSSSTMISMELDMYNTRIEGLDTVKTKMQVRGGSKLDRVREPNVYFFNPREDGIAEGRFRAKMELVQNNVLNIGEAFTEDEIRTISMRGVITRDQADSIVREIRHG